MMFVCDTTKIRTIKEVIAWIIIVLFFTGCGPSAREIALHNNLLWIVQAEAAKSVIKLDIQLNDSSSFQGVNQQYDSLFIWLDKLKTILDTTSPPGNEFNLIESCRRWQKGYRDLYRIEFLVWLEKYKRYQTGSSDFNSNDIRKSYDKIRSKRVDLDSILVSEQRQYLFQYEIYPE
jgi:hypothetical protein